MKENNVHKNVNAAYIWIVNTDFFSELVICPSILHCANFQTQSKVERILWRALVYPPPGCAIHTVLSLLYHLSIDPSSTI